jgi:hypothetical protein
MNDRPTPETDQESFSTIYQGEIVKASFARRLERQRNELLDFLTKLDAMACDDECGSSDFRKICRYDIPKAIAAALTGAEKVTTAAFAGRLEQQRDELLEAMQRIDPFPSDEIEESWNGSTVYCEITVADIRLIRAAIAKVKKSGA